MNKFSANFFLIAPKRGFFCVTKQVKILHANTPQASLFFLYL